MHFVKLASLVACLMLVACQPGESEGADEAEASASESSSGSESEASGSSSTDASSTDASSTDASSTDAGSTDAGSTDASSTDAGSTDASSTDASSTDAGSTDASSTDASSTTIGESTSDTGFESCEMIEMLYDELVNSPLNAACSADADCHVVEGHCWMGLGGCWYVVNQNLQQTELEQLANGFTGLDCFGPICLCLEAPDSVGCVDGTCMPLP